MKYPPIQYHDYLHLDQLLKSQTLRSETLGTKAHDEMLFIIVHQTYELWFKQMLHEVDSVLATFSESSVPEEKMGQAVARLERVVEIQKFINGQVDLLETMTPLDFLDFRDYLYPASGFQSLQWRLLETKLGLKMDQRFSFQDSPFFKQLKSDQQAEIQSALTSPSLFDLIQNWLQRTPFLQTQDFTFWSLYQDRVRRLFQEEREVITRNPRLSDQEKQRSLHQTQISEEMFESLFNKEKFKKLQQDGYFRFSFEAIHAALLIQLYRDEPILQMPHRLIQALIDLDEYMTQWRYRHAQMVHRMIGQKIGTGGSSGHDYLNKAAEHHKVWKDFFNLSTFYIPRSQVPPLPRELMRKMRYSEV